MSQYSIKDLEKLSGIQAHTLRMWEKRYQLIEPHRTSTNIRYYDDNHLKKILNVSVLIKAGKKIGWISALNNEVLYKEILSLYQTNQKQVALEADVNGLVVAMMELDEKRFENIYNARVQSYGYLDTMVKLIYPFLTKVGILWGINEINPAQEHFISNLIRQKMIVACDNLGPEYSTDKTILFFLPDGELHEIGLMLSHFIAKQKGHKCIYLGQSVPMDDLKRVQKIASASHAVTFLTTARSSEEMSHEIDQIIDALGDCKLLVSGYATLIEKIKLPKQVDRIHDVEDYIEKMSALAG